MNNSILQTTLKELNIPAFIQHTGSVTLARMIASRQGEDTFQPTPEKLSRYGFIFEKQGIRLLKQLIAKQENVSKEDIYECFYSASICWHTLTLLPDESQQSLHGHISATGVHVVELELQDELLPPELILVFPLSAAELLGGRIAETRLDSGRFLLSLQSDRQGNWRNLVVENTLTAFVLLVRQAHGWTDIQHALQAIETLRQMQKGYEASYLEKIDGPEQQANAALELVGLYHLAQLVPLAAHYLQTGQPGYDNVRSRLDHHYEQAVEALEAAQHLLLAHFADLFWAGCRELVQHAI